MQRVLVMMIVLAVAGCASPRKEPLPCPDVRIIREMSRQPQNGQTLTLRGIRNVTCEAAGAAGMRLSFDVLAEANTGQPLTAPRKVPVVLMVAGVDATEQQLLARQRVAGLHDIGPDGTPRATLAVPVQVTFEQKGIGKVFVGLSR